MDAHLSQLLSNNGIFFAQPFQKKTAHRAVFFLEKYGEGSRTFLLPIFRKNGQNPKKLCPLFPICSGKT